MNTRDPQSGNVLFLILIAVALFAALSYIVSQSTRSGGGGYASEKIQLSASQLLQNGIGIRTALMRMINAGIKQEDLDFWWDANPVGAVFGKDGGAARINIPPDILPSVSGSPGFFYHAPASTPVSVANIGTSAPDIVMGLNFNLDAKGEQICAAINKKLGIDTIPGSASGPDWPSAAPGKAVACVRNWNTFYIYYFVLYEN